MLHPPVESGQYTAIRYAERLADAGALASSGTVGDSYYNALDESVIGMVPPAEFEEHYYRQINSEEHPMLGEFATEPGTVHHRRTTAN